MEQDLAVLRSIGQLLEEAIGIADGHDETLVAVHIDQALHALGLRVAQVRGWRA